MATKEDIIHKKIRWILTVDSILLVDRRALTNQLPLEMHLWLWLLTLIGSTNQNTAVHTFSKIDLSIMWCTLDCNPNGKQQRDVAYGNIKTSTVKWHLIEKDTSWSSNFSTHTQVSSFSYKKCCTMLFHGWNLPQSIVPSNQDHTTNSSTCSRKSLNKRAACWAILQRQQEHCNVDW